MNKKVLKRSHIDLKSIVMKINLSMLSSKKNTKKNIVCTDNIALDKYNLLQNFILQMM